MASKQTYDFAKTSEQFMSVFNVDTKAIDDAVRTAVEFNTRLGGVAIDAARKNIALTTAWSSDTLGRIEAGNTVRKDAADYAAAASEFAVEQAREIPEKLAEYAEVARQAQMATIDLFVDAGKTMQTETASTAKTAK